MGWKEVVLLERDRLTSGSTWHAAGLIVTFGSTSETSTEMRKYTRDLYARLEAETGQATGFKPVGFIEVATDADRLEEYRRVAAFNRYCGVDVQEISPRGDQAAVPARADRRHPCRLLREGGRSRQSGRRHDGAGEGRAHAGRAHHRRRAGHRRPEQAMARVTGVRTAQGDIDAEFVVNCAGMWARQLGERVGVSIPNAGRRALLPDHRADPGSAAAAGDGGSRFFGYFREEVGGLMVGLFEPVCAPWNVGGMPDDFSFGEIPPDWDRMGPYLEKAMNRVPVTL